jgi:hypothetical protein
VPWRVKTAAECDEARTGIMLAVSAKESRGTGPTNQARFESVLREKRVDEPVQLFRANELQRYQRTRASTVDE